MKNKMTVDHVDFSYNGKKVLHDIDLDVREGEILSLIGPNGSGKSTLLRCLNGLLEPKKGSIRLDGEEVSQYDPLELSRKIAYVPQIEVKGFPKTVFDTILMGRRPYMSWKPSKKDLESVNEMIEIMGMQNYALRDINKLSGGQRQKVFIARAIVQEPDVLLLDEPTSNLDLKHQLEVLDLIKQQAQKGISVVIAIHDLNMAVRYSDRVVLLKEGRIHDSGGLEIITDKNIEEVYGVKVFIGEHAGWMVVTPDEAVG
ncbi:MAG: ABC transporter ATP-binding protein [Thermoplasmata archaeon]